MLIENLPATVVLVVILAFIYAATRTNHERLQIRKKGNIGALCNTRLPLGIDFIYKAVSSQLQGTDVLFWERLLRSHGNSHRPYTVGVEAVGRRLIYTADPENIKAVLSSQFTDYGKGRWLSREWRALFGHSILSTDGQMWQDGRKMLRMQLAREQISDLSILQACTEHALSGVQRGNVIDVKDLFFKFTLDFGTKFLLGESTNTLDGNEEGVRFGAALDDCQRFVMLQAVTGKVGKVIPKTSFNNSLAVVNAFVHKQVRRALRSNGRESAENHGNRSPNLIHTLIEYTRDPTVLRDQLLAALIGARDTTACCLCWLFYSLAQHPDVTAALRREILHTVGSQRMPTWPELKDMTYLQDTIKETLRLYPSVPFDIRWALKDTSLPRGGGEDGSEPIGILESTPIIYSIQYLHLLGDFHEVANGDAPDISTFAPHRWRLWRPKHWTYLPFNGGPRLCVGQQFALTEIAYVVVRLLQRFETVTWMGDDAAAYADPTLEGNTAVERFLMAQKLGMHSEIVLAPDKEVKVSFT